MTRLFPLLLALVAIASPATAGLITFEVHGTTQGAYPQVPSPGGWGGWETATPITLTYTFDSTTVGTWNSFMEAYVFDAITAYHLEVGSTTFSNPNGGGSNIDLFDNVANLDRYIAGFYHPSQPTFASGVELGWFQLDFYDWTDWLPTSASLPTSPAGLNACAVKSGRLMWNNGVQEFMKFDSVSFASAPVPEIDPNTSGSAFTLVLGALGLLERRARAKSG